MFKIDLITVGRLSNGPLQDCCKEYQKRITWPLNLIELESKTRDARKANQEENQKILEKLNPHAFIIIMDEKGKTLSSRDFTKKIKDQADIGAKEIQFIIGGADGLSDEVRTKANLLLSFGKQTWPHMLARVMLLEQIYRAQQIMAGHPYHRD